MEKPQTPKKKPKIRRKSHIASSFFGTIGINWDLVGSAGNTGSLSIFLSVLVLAVCIGIFTSSILQR